MLNPYENIEKGDAVLVIDVQKDFCPGGALAVKDGDAVVRLLNQWIEAAFLKGSPVYLSRDWHPVKHPSFKDCGGPWPPHCIQDTDGARFHPDLKRPENTVVVTKGVRFDIDQYSVFDQTGLGSRLKQDRVRTLWVGGLAQDPHFVGRWTCSGCLRSALCDRCTERGVHCQSDCGGDPTGKRGRRSQGDRNNEDRWCINCLDFFCDRCSSPHRADIKALRSVWKFKCDTIGSPGNTS